MINKKITLIANLTVASKFGKQTRENTQIYILTCILTYLDAFTHTDIRITRSAQARALSLPHTHTNHTHTRTYTQHTHIHILD